MATWRDVFQRARDVRVALKRRRAETTRYEPANGKPVTGWLLYNLWGTSDDEERYPGNNNYRQVWTDEYLVLGVDGKIYKYTILKEEYGSGWSGEHSGTTVEKPSIYLMEPPSTWIHGRRIKPDEVMGALNTLHG